MKISTAFLLLFSHGPPPRSKRSSRTLRDKIEGGWAGQMIGVSFGAPTEFRSNAKINTAELPKWTPDASATRSTRTTSTST